MKVNLMLFFLLAHLNLHAQDQKFVKLEDSIRILKAKVDRHYKNIDTINGELSKLKKYVDSTNTIVATGNSTISNMLTGGALVITLLSIVLVVYIQKKATDFDKIEKKIDRRLKIVKKLKKDVQNINFEIENVFESIYNKIQLMEVDRTIEMLQENPQSFDGFAFRLALLPIPTTYFQKFLDISKIKGFVGRDFIEFIVYKFPIQTLLNREYILMYRHNKFGEIDFSNLLKFAHDNKNLIKHYDKHFRQFWTGLLPEQEDYMSKIVSKLSKPMLEEVENYILELLKQPGWGESSELAYGLAYIRKFL